MRRLLCALAVPVLLGGILGACDVGAPPERVITYRISSRGHITSDLAQFAQHVAATLSDPRGWSAGGAIEFRQVTGPAEFTVVLAQASTMGSFGSPCHPAWSCRSGSNVIINQDRWQGATSTWPYSLDSYQNYVVNHEVGHWLGLGHSNCTGGFWDRAPAMAQQSKGGAAKGACRFNVWPNPDEIAAASRNKGVTPRYSGFMSPDDPFGSLDAVEVVRNADGKPTSVRVVGWTVDGDTPKPLGVVILVDRKPVDIVLADKPRTDIAKRVPYSGPNHGYDATVAVAPSSQVVCVTAGGVGAGLPFVQLGCKVVK